MPGLSAFSEANLRTCDHRIQNIVRQTASIYEVRVLCGRRSIIEQERLFLLGRTKLHGGESTHNPKDEYPVDDVYGILVPVVDVVPYPINWHDAKRFIYMAGMMQAFAEDEAFNAENDFRLRWGGNWDMDMVIIDDQNFDDLPHFEIVEA